MSSVQANDVIDLAGSPSPMKPMAPLSVRMNNISLRKKRRSPRFPNNGMLDNNDDNGNVNNNDNDGARKKAPEIVDLLADSPPPSPPGLTSTRRKVATTGRKRPRPRPRRLLRSSGLMGMDDDDDDDIIEIIDPPSFASAATGRKQQQRQPAGRNKWVDRIRVVFPLVSRAKVETFLAMARSYSTDGSDDESAVHTVMSVLAEDPIGASISESSFAAASVGGRLEGGMSAAGGAKVAELECQCCYVEYDVEIMVSCRNGHLFCTTCLQKHTEQRVFGVGNLGVKPSGANNAKQTTSKALEILCMASECTFGFQEGALRKALPEKVMKKYDELQFKAVIESANMGDVSKCSKCEFVAVCDPTWPKLLFHCPQCHFKSCKECDEEYHPSIRCDQVEKKHETHGRNTVEEAMTTALIRKCPRPLCGKKFLKSDGCNKMTCSCGCFICYVCRKEIPAAVAYTHFCQTPHCQHKSCKKCPLYADTSDADKKRVTDAAKNAARSAKKMNVNVDVDSMLKDPPTAPVGRKR